MQSTLVIYDATGRILSAVSGNYEAPSGVPYLVVDIPEGQRITSIDVSGEVHEAIFEDAPQSELNILKEDAAVVADMTAMLAEDNMFIAETLAMLMMEIDVLKEEVATLKGGASE